MRKFRLAAVPVAALLVLAACQPGGQASGSGGGGDTSKGTIKIGVDLPLSGGEAPNGQPTLNGVKLAVKEAGGAVAGYAIEIAERDDAVNGVHNPDQGAQNATELASDEAVVAIVGPYNSNVGAAMIPVTAEAGLLQCSPANTNPGLTKPEFGADDLRGGNDPSYIRMATTDDLQGPAMAEYAFTTKGIQSVFIIDDTETYGDGIADTFEAHFEELGGTVTGRQGVPNPDGTADYTSILTAAQADNPEGVFFGGVTTTGAARVRAQMADVGMGDLPYFGGDGLVDGNGETDGSFVNIAGEAAANSFASVAAPHDIPDPDAFNNAYQAEYGASPGPYSAPAYACTQVVLAAIEAAAASATDMASLRSGVRDAVFENTGTEYDTVLGPVSFDENGDTSQHIMSFYGVDLAAEGGGNWVFDSQDDFSHLLE
jgi:branched-chain amino acid transport system substrate-binding protein